MSYRCTVQVDVVSGCDVWCGVEKYNMYVLP